MIKKFTFLWLLIIVFSVTNVFASNPRKLKKLEDMQAEQSITHQFQVNGPASPWTPGYFLPTFPMYNFKAISNCNDSIFWVGGASISGSPAPAAIYGFCFKMAGLSWPVPIKQFAFADANLGGIASLAAYDENIVLVGLYSGEIIRSTNGGAKFDTVFVYNTPDTAWINDIKFVPGTDTVYAYGDADSKGLFVGRSVDKGATWTRLTLGPKASKADSWYGYASYSQGMAVIPGKVWITAYSALATKDSALLISSTNGGQTWTETSVFFKPDVATNYYFRSINFKNKDTGYAVSRRAGGTTTDFDGWYHRTIDGGLTWSDTISLEPGQLHKNQKVYSVQAIPNDPANRVLAVGVSLTTGSKSWISGDGGLTFTPLLTPGLTNLTNMLLKNPLQMMLVGYRNLLLSYPSVNVTFKANTAFVPDTLKSNSFVQVRGGTAPLTWDKNSMLKMVNKGGDYWEATGRFPNVSTPVAYKFFTNANASIGSNNEHQGWEGNLGTGDRFVQLTLKDTVIDLGYVNGWSTNGPALEDKPWGTTPAGMIPIHMRVNMQSADWFDARKHKVGARGSNMGDWGATGPLSWGETVFFTPEQPHANGGSQQYNAANFWSKTLMIPEKFVKDSAFVGKGFRIKIVVHNITAPANEDWGQMVRNPNVEYDIIPTGGIKDTTVFWKWFEDKPYKPGAGTDTVVVEFRADMSQAIATKGFTPGDPVIVRAGFGGTAAGLKEDTLRKVGLTNIYKGNVTLTGVLLNSPLFYQYYNNEVRETYYDFEYNGTDVSLAERRMVKPDSKNIAVVDTAKLRLAPRRMPIWRNLKKLSKVVDVKYTLDLRPAYWQVKHGKAGNDTLIDIQGTTHITKANADSIMKWGAWMNGPTTGGWQTWGGTLYGDVNRKMADDGTNGDAVKGDSIFTKVYRLGPDSVGRSTIGQEFKFGIKGGDNEGGKGGYGNNHFENIDDASSTFTVHSQFGSINPKYYENWNFDSQKPNRTTSVKEIDGITPLTFALEQNFPNPFNPSTKIAFSIPTDSKVMLKVYNMVGQEVAMLLNENKKAAKYEVDFNASKLASGIYFYKINAGNFTSTKKMILIK